MGSLFAREGKFAGTGKFAVSPYGASVVLTAKKAVANAVGAAISWDSDSGSRCYNEGECWLTANKTRFTAPEEGIYQLFFCVTWGETAISGERSVFITVNGGADNKLSDSQGTFQSETQICSAMALLAKGDYMEARVFQESGAAEELLADSYGVDYKVGRATFEKVR